MVLCRRTPVRSALLCFSAVEEEMNSHTTMETAALVTPVCSREDPNNDMARGDRLFSRLLAGEKINLQELVSEEALEQVRGTNYCIRLVINSEKDSN